MFNEGSITDERDESRTTDEPVSDVFWPIWRRAEGALIVAVRDRAAFAEETRTKVPSPSIKISFVLPPLPVDVMDDPSAKTSSPWDARRISAAVSSGALSVRSLVRTSKVMPSVDVVLKAPIRRLFAFHEFSIEAFKAAAIGDAPAA